LTAGQILNAQATYRSRGHKTLATTEFKRAGASTDPPRAEAERWRSWVMETSDGDPDDQTPTLLTDRAELFECRKTGSRCQSGHYQFEPNGLTVI
jgi:hypothetical protein